MVFYLHILPAYGIIITKRTKRIGGVAMYIACTKNHGIPYLQVHEAFTTKKAEKLIEVPD